MQKNNRFYCNEETLISFSGGRTSAYMLWRVIDAHGGELPDYVHVVFCNTGKEMPQTLNFVRDCAVNWGVHVTWLERRTRKGGQGENMYVYSTEVVTHETASRNGEPFAELIAARQYLPNPVARFCTQELKVRAIEHWLKDAAFDLPIQSMIGIRADEPRRAAKIKAKPSVSAQELIVPLFDEGITKQHVSAFWHAQAFDLNLPNNNGTTDWGNCDLCYLKGANKKISILRERPDLADWWIGQERLTAQATQKAGAFFRNDHPSYAEMKIIATDQHHMLQDDETIPCLCGD
jgi:3'-phosphoadenosine 5'-phosphosulfate sulfotransferase (PAPS reductase)/FAD synthetase